PAYRACSSGQSQSASGHSTRLAVRDQSTARWASAWLPTALTPAMVAVAFSQPSASSSSASRYSRPLAQETKKFMWRGYRQVGFVWPTRGVRVRGVGGVAPAYREERSSAKAVAEAWTW